MLVISHRRIQTAFHNILYHSGYDTLPTQNILETVQFTCFGGQKVKANLSFSDFGPWAFLNFFVGAEGER